ncbi:hypothetical protein K458DRAFT_315059, partial [Lentithecium fluviatile CBS 122367]
ITIRVGKEPDHQDFLLHEGTMYARSEFFGRAMNGNWQEKEEHLVRLPQDKAEIFDYYTHLVNTRDRARPQTKASLRNEYTLLCHVYVLSEKLLDVKAKNATVKAILKVANESPTDGNWVVPPSHAVRVIYERTPPTSPARVLMVDL